jgi:ectoine hydroxylase-related dioxygenase (phytanoyl-CoA dioxygenase family)
MTTHPQGYMIAAWFALEDAHEDAGPLTLWSGSHRLPYLSAREVGIPRDAPADQCSRIYAENYYARNRQRIEAHGLRPFHYLAKRGEVLLWHANVLHGGARITRPDSTRRSLVVHYYGEGVHHYSDLFHWPSPLPQLG